MSIDNGFRGCRSFMLVGGAAALLAAAGAFAQTPAAAPAQSGLMSFPNVRVETAPASMVEAFASRHASRSGFRAFIDPSTGQLAEPIAEEVQALEALEQSRRTVAKAVRRSPAMYGPNGAIGLKLDESTMSFSVARKTVSGSIIAACLPGESDAAAWLENPRSFGLPLVASTQVKEELQ